MVGRRAAGGEGEVASEEEGALVPADGESGVYLVSVVLDQPADTGILERYRSIHTGILVECEHTSEPAIAAASPTGVKVFCECPLVAFLP